MNSRKLILVYLISLSLPVFSQSAEMSLIPYRHGDLWGYSSADKKIIIEPAYDDANFFYVGFASVKKGIKYGYINKSGKLVIPYKYFSATRFRYGYTDNLKTLKSDTVLYAGAALSSDAIERCIDTRGIQMTKCPAINENSISGNSKKLIKDTLISSFGTLLKNEKFDTVLEQYNLPGKTEDYYVAVKDNRYGIINNKFETIAPFEYTSIKKMIINNAVYLAVEKNILKGILNGNGSVLIDPENNRLDHITAINGLSYFIIGKNGGFGIRDINLTDLVTLKYGNIQYDSSGIFVLTGLNNLKGAYFLNNKILEAKYADVNVTNNNNYVKVKLQSGKSGYVNSEGIEFFEN